MTCYLLYNRQTPAERQMAEFKTRLDQAQVDSELVDADSPRGIMLAESYDLLGRPAVILMKDDGTPLQTWQGEDIPAVADISYLSHH